MRAINKFLSFFTLFTGLLIMFGIAELSQFIYGLAFINLGICYLLID